MRHALDADHVVVVSTLLAREPSPWRAARLAALWGAGHTLAFLGLGFVVLFAGLRVTTTVSSRALAAAYLGLVALGTVLGMVALTLVLHRPILWTMQRGGSLTKLVVLAAGGLGIALGGWILVRPLFERPAP